MDKETRPSWVRGGCYLDPMWLSFAPGLTISVVTHNKPDITAQRERQALHMISLKTTTLPCFHCISSEACGLTKSKALGHCSHAVGHQVEPHRSCVAIKCWVTGGHRLITRVQDSLTWRSWVGLIQLMGHENLRDAVCRHWVSDLGKQEANIPLLLVAQAAVSFQAFTTLSALCLNHQG